MKQDTNSTIIGYNGTRPYDHPVKMTTPLLQYDRFFVARTKVHPFSYLKTPVIRPPRYYDQRPPFEVISPYFRYKITLLILPINCLIKKLSEDRNNLKNNALKFYSMSSGSLVVNMFNRYNIHCKGNYSQ